MSTVSRDEETQKPFASSYFISNRAAQMGSESFKPLPNGEALYFRAPGQPLPKPYNNDPTAYTPDTNTPSTKPPDAFRDALLADLQANGASSGTAQLTIYIHGLGNSAADAVEQYGDFGNALFRGKSLEVPSNVPESRTYQGLVVAFDWPTSGDLLSNLSPATYRQTRQNAVGSTAAFRNLFVMVTDLRTALEKKGISLSVGVICHSEGNFMMMVGAQQVVASPPAGFRKIDQVILLAADINFGAFNVPTQDVNLNQGTGTGAAIAAMANQVSIYYSSYYWDDIGDKALLYSFEAFGDQHNTDFQHRIGRYGPDYRSGQQNNTVGVDCINVADTTHLTRLWYDGEIPLSTIIHTCYRVVPQILQDIAETLRNVPAGKVFDRAPGANSQNYLMTAITDEARRYEYIRVRAEVRS